MEIISVFDLNLHVHFDVPPRTLADFPGVDYGGIPQHGLKVSVLEFDALGPFAVAPVPGCLAADNAGHEIEIVRRIHNRLGE